jgi:hypothetical protein
MSKFTFTNPLNGQKIEVDGPPALTEAQAQQIFKQQFDAGSLVGLKPGDAIDSASQLAGGLLSAAAQTTQALLPQASSLLNQGTQLASGAISSAAANLSGVTDTIKNIVPTNPINVADLAKEVSGLVPIQGLSQLDVRAAVSQAGKIVGQASDAISNSLGVGKFGFDAQQLERAGVLKPGTFSTYISAGAANLTSVLNSPAVWTGANGITDVNKLLGSLPTQNLIQQDLMSQGLAGAKELGISIDKLGASAQAGLALNASKSINDAVNWAKGLSLPPDIKQSLDQVARDGAFAVDFANSTANDAVRQEEPANPAIDTADRATIDAAVSRVTGNDKIPVVNFQSIDVAEIKATLTANFKELTNSATQTYKDLNNRASAIIKDFQIAKTSDSPAVVSGTIEYLQQLLSDDKQFKDELLGLERRAEAVAKELGATPQGTASIQTLKNNIDSAEANLKSAIEKLRLRLETLSSRQ